MTSPPYRPLGIDCPTCQQPVTAYEVHYGTTTDGSGLAVKTPRTDVMTLQPCGHTVTGQAAIIELEHTRETP